jgi:hypothetical protein
MTERESQEPGMFFISLGVAFGLVLTGVWLALTLRTGLTYHFFPFAIAVAPTALARFLDDRPLRYTQAVFASVIGLLLVALGWMILVASGEDPSATFIDGQPGGVIAEIIVIAGLGAIVGTTWAIRRQRSLSPGEK